jgi:hypothetical protein
MERLVLQGSFAAYFSVIVRPVLKMQLALPFSDLGYVVHGPPPALEPPFELWE